ncbi:MAG: hypothetical protein JNJ93_08050 [Acinetobacter sp.]|nr:hypothetical protein [Acinetobacter sp.]
MMSFSGQQLQIPMTHPSCQPNLQSGKSKVLPTKESFKKAHLVLCYDGHARFRANMLTITFLRSVKSGYSPMKSGYFKAAASRKQTEFSAQAAPSGNTEALRQ